LSWEFIMSFAAVMVHVDVEEPCDSRIRLAALLSSRLCSALIGVAAWEPRTLTYGVVDTGPVDDLLQHMSDQLAQAGAHFRAVVGPEQPTEWRTGIESPTEFLVREARAADLVVIGRPQEAGIQYRRLDPSATVLRAGRPVLVVPPHVDSIKAERVVVGWRDTREARRALRDSLPLIRDASSVTIVEIADLDSKRHAQAHIDDVARYLSRHHIAASVKTLAYSAESATSELVRIADEMNADLIVAGGYGHSRLGEWMFGGVTRGLLGTSPVCCLLSH
jgi:nucleotide-binding universal stress UspA family protein